MSLSVKARLSTSNTSCHWKDHEKLYDRDHSWCSSHKILRRVESLSFWFTVSGKWLTVENTKALAFGSFSLISSRHLTMPAIFVAWSPYGKSRRTWKMNCKTMNCKTSDRAFMYHAPHDFKESMHTEYANLDFELRRFSFSLLGPCADVRDPSLRRRLSTHGTFELQAPPPHAVLLGQYTNALQAVAVTTLQDTPLHKAAEREVEHWAKFQWFPWKAHPGSQFSLTNGTRLRIFTTFKSILSLERKKTIVCTCNDLLHITFTDLVVLWQSEEPAIMWRFTLARFFRYRSWPSFLWVSFCPMIRSESNFILCCPNCRVKLIRSETQWKKHGATEWRSTSERSMMWSCGVSERGSSGNRSRNLRVAMSSSSKAETCSFRAIQTVLITWKIRQLKLG